MAQAAVVPGDACTPNGSTAVSPNAASGYMNTLICTGGVWVAAPLMPGTGLPTCNAANAGAIRWSGSSLSYCNGTTNVSISTTAGSGGAPYTPPSGTGYFVLSYGTWVANYANLATANSRCLTDLTNNNWMGKTDATSRGLINSDHVFAFACADAYTCNNVLPNVVYNFAVSGSTTLGGATFLTDANGQGPGNSVNWAGSNYFGSDVMYYGNRGQGSTTLWPLGGAGNYSSSCGNMSDGTSAGGITVIGRGNAADFGRWNAINYGCDALLHLLCYVNP